MRQLEDQDALRDGANQILQEAGALTECVHGTLETTDLPEAERRAYAMAANRFKGSQLQEMKRAIKASLVDHAGDCSACLDNERN